MTDLLDRQTVTPLDEHPAPIRTSEPDQGPVARRRRSWPVAARLAVGVLAVTTAIGAIGWARSARSDGAPRITELQSEIVQLKADAAARSGRIDQLLWAIDELQFGQASPVADAAG